MEKDKVNPKNIRKDKLKGICDDDCAYMKPVEGTENYFCNVCGNHY